MERMRILNSRRLTFCEKRNQCCGKGFCLAMGINDSEDSIGQRSTLPSHLYTGHIITSIRVYKKLPAVLSMTQNGIWKQRGKLIDKQWWSIRFGIVAAVKIIFWLKLNILNKIYDENWQLCFINIPGVSERKCFTITHLHLAFVTVHFTQSICSFWFLRDRSVKYIAL